MKNQLLFLALLLLPLWGLAQQPLRGRVIAAAQQTPLPGATILIKGTAIGTATDAEGYFHLHSVPQNAVLLVSFLGYTPREMPLPDPIPELLEITLSENRNQLGEVVVSTGYQQIPQERATGSFAQVSRERLQEQVSTDVLSRLEAVANGLTVDRGTLGSGGLVVRGLSTIQGPKAPLIVVDNFPYEGDLANLNPNDIASVTVLKDAAAASIWGARAGNGVIVITTRQGRFNQPLSVEFNSNLTVTGKPDLHYAGQMSATDYIDVEQMLYSKGFYNANLNSVNRPAVSPAVELLHKQAQGQISEQEAQAQLQALRLLDVRDQFLQHVYRQGINQQYSLGFRGGAAASAWLLSAGYDANKDPLDAAYRRLSLRFQHNLRPLKNVELSTGLAYTQSHSGSGRQGYGPVSGTIWYPYTQLADEAGNPLPVARDLRQSWKDTVGGGKLLDWNYYPLVDYRHDRRQTDLQEVLAHTGLGYHLPLGLEASLRYQYQRQQTDMEHLQDMDSYETRNLVNLFTRIDPVTGAISYAVPKGSILNQGSSKVEAHNARAQLNFNHTWKNHDLAALAGAEMRDVRTTGSTERRYGYDPSNLTTGLVDYVNRYPTFVNGSLAFVPNPTTLNDRVNRFVSLFGNAAYTYKERYTLTGSARQDASNLFGVRANERWNPLWSTGISWILSEEPFYKLDFLPVLKLRATYGFSGNVDLSRTAVTTILYSVISPYTQEPTAIYDNYANPDLRWERSRMANIGLDFSMKNDRLSGSLEYYQKRGNDLFGRQVLESTAGVSSSIIKNVASMKGSGFDVELNSLNVQAGGFSWTSHLNMSHARDEVTEYYLSNLNASPFVSSVPAVSALPGKPVYAIYAYRWAGLDPQTGDPQGYVNGEVSKDYATLTGSATQVTDLEYHGSALPTFFGSLGNTISYKGFSLTARLSYKMGYYFRRSSIRYATLYSSGVGSADFAKRWQQPGDEAHTQVPSLQYPADTRRDNFYAGSSALVEKGDHVRIQYLTLAYELGKSQWQALPFQRLQAYATAQNLGLLWTANNHGIDPDYALNSFALPPAKSFALGLRVTF